MFGHPLRISLVILALIFGAKASAGINTSVTCTAENYEIRMSENVNENKENPLSIVEVFKDGQLTYSGFYRLNYQKDSDSGLEIWIYESHITDEGGIGVGAISETEAKAELLININSDEFISWSSIDCELTR